MQGRDVYNFTPEVPVTFFRDDKTSALGNLNFTIEFWQPYIDVTKEYRICGPLFSALIEISRALKVSLTFFDDETDEFIPVELIHTKQLHIILTIFPPMNLADPNMERNLNLSRVIGDISTLSILSAKSPSPNPMFRLMRIFDPEVWVGIFIIYFLVKFVCHYLWSINKNLSGTRRDQTIWIDLIAIAFRQGLKNFDRKDSQAPFIMIWYLAAFIFTSAFSGALLSFLVFSKPFKTIDSFSDLAESPVNIFMFDGENSVEYFNDTSEPYHDQFINRTKIENLGNGQQEEWEKGVFTKINKGEAALVSDQAYLDYHFATKLHNYSNLYRSQQDRLILPFFMPFTPNIHQDQKMVINKVLTELIESGVFEFWTEESIFLNNKDRERFSQNDYLHKKYQYKPLAFEHFHFSSILMEDTDKPLVNDIKDKDVKDKDIKDKDVKPQNLGVVPQKMKFTKELDELVVVEKQFNCDVIQEMRELWEIIANSPHENRFENSNVIRVPELGDTILFYQQRSVESKPFIWRSEIVNYPPKSNQILRKAIITGIAIIDSKKTGMGGEATILDGGIGASFVEIKLESRWLRGYSFTIIIIGKYADEDDSYQSNEIYDELAQQ